MIIHMSNLTLTGVTYQYRTAQAPAVADVSCEFEPGVMYAIVGPSGSGKSTMLALLAGLDMPTSGDILLDGESLGEMDLDYYRRERIAMIFQAFQLFPLMTALENVCYPLELCGVKASNAIPRAEKLLESVGIKRDQMKRFPSHLSGGEQQRVAIARSLAAGARILLADEPTGNLDGANTKNIMDILRRLAHDDGYCVIIVTHDMEAADVADVIYKMRDGTLTRV